MSGTITVYVAQQNSDLTEGKGRMVDISYWDNVEDAVLAVKGRGVMGVGDGEVVERSFTFAPQKGEVFFNEERIYAYRKDPFGKWSTGFVDNREYSDVVQSEEYVEFLRLSKKFGGVK